MYGITIETEREVSQYQQIYTQLREKIVNGAILAGEKLCSSRELSKSLKVSRSTVMEVLDQLKVEGFLETRKGSGTYVLDSLTYRAGFSQPSFIREKPKRVSKLISFIPGKPDLNLFPRRSWNSSYTKGVEYSDYIDLGYPDIQGRLDLREEILNYLFRIRGIKAGSNQVFFTTGSSQALGIIAQLKKGSRVLLENPVATFVYRIFREYGCQINFGEVDEEGLVLSSIPREPTDFIYLTPSHQFPLGGVLPGSRRIELLNLANRFGSYIIEDDYDSEYRYTQRPISPLFSLGSNRVIYIGSFSKILAPGIRLGYMIVPNDLIEDVKAIKSRWDMFTEGLNQKAMYHFIKDGLLEKHTRKMLKVYKSRNNYIKSMVKSYLGDGWEVQGESTGLHIILKNSNYKFDSNFEELMASKGVRIFGVNHYEVNSNKHLNKLIIGYGDKGDRELEELFKLLKATLDIKI